MNQERRLASETPSEAQIRHEQDRENHRSRRNMDLALPLFQQPAVRSKMTNFHSKIAALEMSKCITCLEKFPTLNVKAVSAQFSLRAPSGSPHNACISTSYHVMAGSEIIIGQANQFN